MVAMHPAWKDVAEAGDILHRELEDAVKKENQA